MRSSRPKGSAVLVGVAFLIAFPAVSEAQLPSSLSGAAQSAVGELTGTQQSAATKALCAAIAGNYSDAASAGASALKDPKVIATAAQTFAGGMNISVASAAPMLEGFAAHHATDILTSCAASKAAGAVGSAIPGAGSLPSMPKVP